MNDQSHVGGIAAAELRQFIEVPDPVRTDLRVSDLLDALDWHETWRPVEGWPGYEVSSWGQVRGPLKILKPGVVRGYLVVTLSDRLRKKTARVHLLVAEAFLGPPPFPRALVAHNDGIESNCRARNLRWASSRENQADRVRHGSMRRGSKVFGAKLKEEDIPLIRARIGNGERYQSIAKDFGVSVHTISLIKKGRVWKHAGGAAWGGAHG